MSPASATRLLPDFSTSGSVTSFPLTYVSAPSQGSNVTITAWRRKGKDQHLRKLHSGQIPTSSHPQSTHAPPVPPPVPAGVPQPLWWQAAQEKKSRRRVRDPTTTPRSLCRTSVLPPLLPLPHLEPMEGFLGAHGFQFPAWSSLGRLPKPGHAVSRVSSKSWLIKSRPDYLHRRQC